MRSNEPAGALDDALAQGVKPQAPKWNASLAGQYRMALAPTGAIALGADVSYRSRYVNEATDEPLLVQDPVTLVGARIARRGLFMNARRRAHRSPASRSHR